MTDSPSPDDPREPPGGPPDPLTPARRFGAPRDASVVRMEHIRLTAPDERRRLALKKTRGRLRLAGMGFGVLFGAVAVKLALVTVVAPVLPRPVAQRHVDPPPRADASGDIIPAALDLGMHTTRAMITDRNGEILALSLPTAGLYANPREIAEPDQVARRLLTVLPHLDMAEVRQRLADTNRQFVYIARQITPREELAVNDLGVPGLYFQPTERRRYPLGRVAAQVIGGVDVDEHGAAGAEKVFDQRLREDPSPLRLSLDVRVQDVVRDEVAHAVADFNAIAGCGIVMDVRTGEVIAMVSLPDYDANAFAEATSDEQVNRAIGRVYEPGSTFKLQTVSMALDDGVVNIWNGFDASAPIHIGHHTINDFEGKHRWLYVPEIIAYSSNIGAAHMAQAVGTERQRAWMAKLGMLTRPGIELPSVSPLVPPEKNWKEAATLTIGFGQGIAVTPLQVVVGTSAVANAGIKMTPTILAVADGAPPPTGTRIMQQSTSDIVRKLMRLVVTAGYGKPAEVPGYYIGGKTGTAQKTGGGHGYKADARVSAFISVFPMNAPRYAVYVMLDEPKANASTHGFATAGWVSAPAAGRVIARIAPMLGLLPNTEQAATIEASLAIPLQPGRPSGGGTPMARVAPQHPAAEPARTTERPVPLPVPAPRDLRHEATYLVPNDDGR